MTGSEKRPTRPGSGGVWLGGLPLPRRVATPYLEEKLSLRGRCEGSCAGRASLPFTAREGSSLSLIPNGFGGQETAAAALVSG